MKQEELGIKKKYMVFPGHIISKNDGEMHYISYEQLINLYCVNPDECVRYDPSGGNLADLICLNPNYHGNYEVPNE